MNARILDLVSGRRVMDAGCGFGSLVDFLRSRGLEARGVDLQADWIEAGRKRFPKADLRVSTLYSFGFPDKSFDTLIMKETLHHVDDEIDVHRFMAEVRRVCVGRIIVMDPNPTWILRTARKIIRHEDPEVSPERCRKILETSGYEVKTLLFSDVIAFPLSGGYVSPLRLPGIGPLLSGVLFADSALLRLMKAFRLDRWICWRYVMVADFRD